MVHEGDIILVPKCLSIWKKTAKLYHVLLIFQICFVILQKNSGNRIEIALQHYAQNGEAVLTHNFKFDQKYGMLKKGQA